MRRVTLAIVLVSVDPRPSAAVSESIAPWLLFSMGARASGMGGAQITEARGADRLYWNPALLGFQKGLSATSMYFQPVPDLTDDVEFWYASTTGGWDGVGGFGLNYMYLSYGESDATDLSGRLIDTFVSWERAVGMGYGVAISDDVSLGLGAKIIHSDLSPAFEGLEEGKGTTWGVDFGVHVRNILRPSQPRGVLPNGLRFGLSIQNLGPHLTYVDNGAENPLPLDFRMGVGLDAYQDELHRITLAMEMNKVLVRQRIEGSEFNVDPAWKALFTAWADESFSEEFKDAVYGLGLEYGFHKMIFLRTGWVHDETGDITDYTLGAGVQYEYEPVSVRFDYATYPQATNLDRTQRFSFTATVTEPSVAHAGVKSGFNIANVGSGSDDVFTDSRTGLALGGYVAFALNEIVSLQPEALFMMKGDETTVGAGGTAGFRLSYVEIPVLAKLTFRSRTSLRPGIYVGPALGFNVSAEEFMSDGATAEFQSGIEATREVEFSGVVGGSLEYPLGSGGQTLGIEVRYTHAFTRWNVGSGVDFKNKVLSIMGTFGFI